MQSYPTGWRGTHPRINPRRINSRINPGIIVPSVNWRNMDAISQHHFASATLIPNTVARFSKCMRVTSAWWARSCRNPHSRVSSARLAGGKHAASPRIKAVRMSGSYVSSAGNVGADLPWICGFSHHVERRSPRYLTNGRVWS